MGLCETYSFISETDNYQSIDHGGKLRYNSRVLIDKHNMLPSPDDMNNKSDDIYKTSRQKAIIARQPNRLDPAEARIRGLIQDGLLTTDWVKQEFISQKATLLEYFGKSYQKLREEDSSGIFNDTQDTLRKMAEGWKSRIVEGDDMLSEIPQNGPVFIVANHLGAYKPLGLEPKEMGAGFDKMPIDVLYPFPAFFASFMSVSERLGRTLHQAAYEYPDPVGRIQEAAGSLLFVPGQGLEVLQPNTQKVIDKHKNPAIVIFPEGGTTGKASGKGIYDLERFRTGAYVIAGNLQVPIVEAYQYFNPQTGFEIGVTRVFPVLKKFLDQSLESLRYYGDLAQKGKEVMQTKLNLRMGKTV